ncbi:FimD/PapC C-terminal domain-containing protein [Providencia huaxiensis]|uniref:FimD/PapC C-terminal domain-containing protein n=1 Tax=Providencia huaxiensis TaxID=2027290 RepID=UPI0034DDC5C4
MIKGEKILGTISLENNSYPPFGSSVINEKNIEVGIVSDNGFVYLAGINQSDILKVKWGDKSSCHIQIPEKIEIGMEKTILLPCK